MWFSIISHCCAKEIDTHLIQSIIFSLFQYKKGILADVVFYTLMQVEGEKTPQFQQSLQKNVKIWICTTHTQNS